MMSHCRLMLIFFLASVCLAQNAGIVGTVTDSSGAAIPGVSVSLVETETGVVRQAKTNDLGYYSFPLLKAVTHRIQLTKEGFKPLKRDGLLLETGTTTTVDFQMEIGDMSQSVTVAAAAPLLQSETASMGQLIERTNVLNMPISDRRTGGIVRLAATAIMTGEGGGVEPTVNVSLAGGRSRNQMWQVDGGSAQNSAIGIAQIGYNPPSETIQEFKVEINNLSAEYGRTGGGLVLMTTRSGTNEFHGALYDFLRNDRLDARTFFAASKAPLRYNTFGISAGGPIRKNKTFFFFNYEGSRNRDGVTYAGDVLPRPSERQGDFSRRVDATILDPANRQPFPGNVIPTSRIDPIAAKLVALYPAPNLPDPNVARRPTANFLTSAANPVIQNHYTLRLDHNVGRHQVFGGFVASRNSGGSAPRFPNAFADPGASRVENPSNRVPWGLITNLKPNLLNELRFLYENRAFSHRAYGTGSNKNGELGLKGVDPAFFPSVAVTGYQRMGAAPSGNGQQRLLPVRRTIELNDSLTWIHGSHQVKTGFGLRYSKFKDVTRSVAGGSFNFTDRATGDGLATLLLGWSTSASLLDNAPLETRTDYYAVYIQDDWKITRNLTFNLGLRWDMDTPIWEQQNQQSGFDLTAANPVSGTRGVMTFAGQNGRTRYAHDFDKNNFGPRFGFAWRASQSLVVRGGYGILYYPPYLGLMPNRLTGGFGKQASFDSADGGFTPVFLLKDGTPAPAQEERNAGFGAVRVGQRVRFSPEFVEKSHGTGYSEQYNLTVQKQLPGNSALELSYIANLGHRLPAPIINLNVIPLVNGRGPARQDQALRPFPQYNDVLILFPNMGNSSYHGLNAKFEKRYSSGLSFLMNYTWSKMLDDVQSYNELGGPPAPPDAGTAVGTQHRELSKLDKSLSGNHIAHRFIAATMYDLPFGRPGAIGIRNPVLNHIAGGWGLGTVLELRTGATFGIIEQTNRSNAFSQSQRPNLVRDPILASDRSRAQFLAQYFDTSAYQAPGDGVFGSAPRTVCCAPGLARVDLSARKWFPIFEGYRLQFRADFFNFPNRPNFGLPGLLRGAPTFGRILSTVGPGRQIQLSLRLEM